MAGYSAGGSVVRDRTGRFAQARYGDHPSSKTFRQQSSSPFLLLVRLLHINRTAHRRFWLHKHLLVMAPTATLGPPPPPLGRLSVTDRPRPARALAPGSRDLQHPEDASPGRRVRGIAEAALGSSPRRHGHQGRRPVTAAPPQGAGLARRGLRRGEDGERHGAPPPLPASLCFGLRRGEHRGGGCLFLGDCVDLCGHGTTSFRWHLY